ncbi:hypothetical protein NSTCB13_00871 [Nostoc sp. DSM 114160]|jgi:hypothetical protein
MDLSTGWTSVGNGSFSSASGSIPLFSVPGFFNSQIIGIKISTINAKSSWYTGGWIEQKILTELDSTPWITFAKKLEIGGNIIFFPQAIDNYSIDISFPNYFKTVSVEVWIH